MAEATAAVRHKMEVPEATQLSKGRLLPTVAAAETRVLGREPRLEEVPPAETMVSPAKMAMRAQVHLLAPEGTERAVVLEDLLRAQLEPRLVAAAPEVTREAAYCRHKR